MNSIFITGKDFDRLPERACAAIREQGIEVFSEKSGVSVSTLRRIMKKGELGNMRGLTAVRLIAAMKPPPTLEELVRELELPILKIAIEYLKGQVQDLNSKRRT